MKNISFKIIHLASNQGHGMARRTALAACTNELVALMDADDISVSTRFEKQLAFFSANPQTDIIGGQITEFNENPSRPTGIRRVPLTDHEIKNYLKKRCPFNQVSVMFKKAAVEKAGGYQDWYCDEDYYLWARMALKGAVFANIPDILVNVRTGNAMSARRGCWKYFKSEASLQVFLWANNLIGFPRLVYNVLLRFVGEAILPNWLRASMFKFLRTRPADFTKKTMGAPADKAVAKYSPFSVAMCVYGKDNPNHFKAALESIINQTVAPTEVVIVVDGPIPDKLQQILDLYHIK